MFINEESPVFGRMKLVDHESFTLLIDCNGCSQPMSYCAAVQLMKGLGFQLETRGQNDEKAHYEIWKIPVETIEGRNTQNDGKETRVDS